MHIIDVFQTNSFPCLPLALPSPQHFTPVTVYLTGQRSEQGKLAKSESPERKTTKSHAHSREKSVSSKSSREGVDTQPNEAPPPLPIKGKGKGKGILKKEPAKGTEVKVQSDPSTSNDSTVETQHLPEHFPTLGETQTQNCSLKLEVIGTLTTQLDIPLEPQPSTSSQSAHVMPSTSSLKLLNNPASKSVGSAVCAKNKGEATKNQTKHSVHTKPCREESKESKESKPNSQTETPEQTDTIIIDSEKSSGQNSSAKLESQDDSVIRAEYSSLVCSALSSSQSSDSWSYPSQSRSPSPIENHEDQLSNFEFLLCKEGHNVTTYDRISGVNYPEEFPILIFDLTSMENAAAQLEVYLIRSIDLIEDSKAL